MNGLHCSHHGSIAEHGRLPACPLCQDGYVERINELEVSVGVLRARAETAERALAEIAEFGTCYIQGDKRYPQEIARRALAAGVVEGSDTQ